MADKRYHHQMVRVGLGLWGYPSAGTWAAGNNSVRLRPVAKWISHIVHIKAVPAHSAVGYGQTFHTTRPTRIGIIPLGYADGYPLLLSNRGIVRIGPNLHPAPIIGRVNMDQIIIDLTDIPLASIGTLAEIISDDPDAPNAMHRLAELAQSHPYEMLCRISTRIPRKYMK
jgi:alanine racemase